VFFSSKNQSHHGALLAPRSITTRSFVRDFLTQPHSTPRAETSPQNPQNFLCKLNHLRIVVPEKSQTTSVPEKLAGSIRQSGNRDAKDNESRDFSRWQAICGLCDANLGVSEAYGTPVGRPSALCGYKWLSINAARVLYKHRVFAAGWTRALACVPAKRTGPRRTHANAAAASKTAGFFSSFSLARACSVLLAVLMRQRLSINAHARLDFVCVLRMVGVVLRARRDSKRLRVECEQVRYAVYK
jgi:hypothetical protein